MRSVPTLDREAGPERRRREVSWLHLTRCLQQMLDRKDKMSMASGVEARVPFCDHRLVEYMFNVPWHLKNIGGSAEKGLLRTALGHLLPDVVARRPKSPYPNTRETVYEIVIRDLAREVLADPDAPIRPLLDEPVVRSWLDQPLADTTVPAQARHFSQLVDLNQWMERYSLVVEL